MDDVKLFLALVDMDYFIVISVDNTMGANYFVVFVFRINRKEAIDFKKMTLSLRLLLV